MFGVYQTYYSSSLTSSSPSAISWIGSTQAFLLFLIGTLVGPIYDSGYVRSLLVAGSLLSVLGLFMTSICNQYWQFLISQGMVTGAGFGCLFLPGVTVVSQYFSTKKAFATGIASLGSSIGAYSTPCPFCSETTSDLTQVVLSTHCLYADTASYRCRMGNSCHCIYSPVHLDPSARRHTAS